jgi:hypothetical protein
MPSPPVLHQLQPQERLLRHTRADHHHQLERSQWQRWLVPVGGGIGRIMRLGFQPVNVSVQAYGNAKRPDNFSVSDLAVEISNRIFVSEETQGVVTNIRKCSTG